MISSRFFRQVTAVLAATLLMMSFQNCGRPGSSTSSSNGLDVGAGSQVGVVAGGTASYSQLTFDPNLENSRPQKSATAPMAIDLDLDKGTIVYRGTSVKTCVLDVEREQKIKRIISLGRICRAEIPDGQVACMAISLADIRLANANDSVLLNKVVCSRGTFLCDGDDDTLRGILQDLIVNPVLSCQ